MPRLRCELQPIISGDISIAKPLVATYPSSSYQLTGFVYDSAACNYGSCQFYLTVTFTNYVSITVTLSELNKRLRQSRSYVLITDNCLQFKVDLTVE